MYGTEKTIGISRPWRSDHTILQHVCMYIYLFTCKQNSLQSDCHRSRNNVAQSQSWAPDSPPETQQHILK